MKLFSGTSNRPLAEAVAHALGVRLGNAEITRFIDSECRVFVNEDVSGDDVFVLQSLSEVADQNLVELCLLGQALHDGGAKRVTAVIPWMGYSKQDKAFRRGEAISIQLVAKVIEAAGFDAVITCELHSREVLKYFHIPVAEISTHVLLWEAFERYLQHSVADAKERLGKFIVVSPDKGGTSRSERFANVVGADIVYLKKSRDLVSGDVSVTDISGDVSGNAVIMFDDIINTGQTAIKTSAFVRSKGASAVYFLATHAVLAGTAATALAGSDIDKILVTDTIDIPKEKQFEKLMIVPIAHELASQITAKTD